MWNQSEVDWSQVCSAALMRLTGSLKCSTAQTGVLLSGSDRRSVCILHQSAVLIFMELLCFWLNLLLGLCVRSSFALPSTHYAQHASFQSPQITESSRHPEQQKVVAEEREQVNTVRVTCHPDSLEIVIKADMFGVGAPVNGDELRLGVEYNDYCRPTTSSGDEYRIIVGLVDCGTKHWVRLLQCRHLFYIITSSSEQTLSSALHR